ncbi:FACT complex subunit SSRP1/POB3, partial [Tremellales sp. Uapishka_1]
MSTVTFDNSERPLCEREDHNLLLLVFLGDAIETGKLRFNAAGFGWKAEGGEPTTFNGSDVRSATWFRVGRNFRLSLAMKLKDKARVTLEGFRRDDHEKLRRTLDEFFNVKLETKDTSLKGWNWGKAVVQNQDVAFQVQHKTAFELPLSAIANTNIAAKNEVALEFNAPATSSKSRDLDELVEMRFYVPGKSMKRMGSEAGSGDEETDLDEEGNEISAAEAMHKLIQEKADIGAVSGNSVVIFEDVLVLTPRGRFSFEFFEDSIRLLGKSTDYRILFNSIDKIFLLPKLDDLHVQLVLGLNPNNAIRQGATRYPFLVAQWPKDEEVDAELNLSEEEIAKYPDLQKKYEAPTFQVVSRVLKSMTGKKVTPPGSFRNSQGLNGIKANVKAIQGELYFLEKGLIFIAKQPIYVEFSKTESISFSRVGGGIALAKTFDMRVVSKTEPNDHVFSAISKEENEPISNFLQLKNVRLKNEMEEVMDVDPISDDDEDDDMDSIHSEEDTKSKKKDKGKSGAQKSADDDDSESEDEDFASESSDGGSPSESDSDAASDADSVASDPMMEELKRKQAAKKKKKNQDASTDDEDKPKKKKAKQDD